MFSKQIFWKQYQSVMRHSVGPDLNPNCLQGLVADDEKMQLAGKELCTCTYTCFVFFVAVFVCLFDLFLYVHSTIFQLCGTVLPGFNQY